MKQALPWLIALIAVVVTVVVVLKTYSPDPEYWVRRSVYLQDVSKQEQKIKDLNFEITEKEKIIAEAKTEREEAIKEQVRLKRENDKLRAQDKVLVAEIEKIKTELQSVVDSNPLVKELLRNYELRLFKKEEQIINLTAMVEEARREAEANYRSFVSATAQALAWKKAFEDERALRQSCEALGRRLELSSRRSQVWEKVGKYGIPLAFGLGMLISK